MGDCETEPLRPQFDRRFRLQFFGAKVTSDAGLLAYRELDDALDLTHTAAGALQDSRTGQNTQHSVTALMRQSIYSRLAGYEDLNDAERLRFDPALRTVVGGQARDHTATISGGTFQGGGLGDVGAIITGTAAISGGTFQGNTGGVGAIITGTAAISAGPPIDIVFGS